MLIEVNMLNLESWNKMNMNQPYMCLALLFTFNLSMKLLLMLTSCSLQPFESIRPLRILSEDLRKFAA